MLCWKKKVHPDEKCYTGSASIEPLPKKEQPSALIIVNHEALDQDTLYNNNNNSNQTLQQERPITPVIRVWEGDFELVDPCSGNSLEAESIVENQGVETQSAPDKSFSAWQEKENGINVSHKSTSMSNHETLGLMSKDAEDEGDIELDEIVSFDRSTESSSTVLEKEGLLKATQKDDDQASLSSLEEHQTPSFASSRLRTSVDSVQENYTRQHSEPVVIEASDFVVENLSTVKETNTNINREDRVSSTSSSNVSKTEYQHDNHKSQTFVNENIEMSELTVVEDREDLRKTSLASSHTDEETHLFQTSTPHRDNTVMTDVDVVQGVQDVSYNNDDDNVSVASETSEGSEFLGSLGIYIAEGTWDSDLRVDLDLQLGRDEWQTRFSNIEGDATLEGWGTDLRQIAKNDDDAQNWRSSLSEISNLDAISLKSDWNSSISESLIKSDKPEDWKTDFSEPEPLTNDRLQWKSFLTKVKERIYDKNEWKTTFRKIGNRKRTGGDDWNFKLTDKFQSQNDKDRDWGFKFNKLGSVTLGEDDWRIQKKQMDVRSDDRSTHWKTKFQKIQEKNEDPKAWQTQFRKMEPIPEDRTWKSDIVPISNDLGTEADWNIKFIDIEKNGERPEDWNIDMKDVPDSTRDPADWNIKFKQLEEHLQNPKESWGFKFNQILEHTELDKQEWATEFYKLDKGENNSWDIKFNQVEELGERELDWNLKINDIELADGVE
ncbi:uncharacterized protein [Clytia hemisphaerica]|uniref:Uncharacterized protein n=1 Tax=Clytia hemisphaerica TaxID=252671 RepID=A0A7M5VH85_9CNID